MRLVAALVLLVLLGTIVLGDTARLVTSFALAIGLGVLVILAIEEVRRRAR